MARFSKSQVLAEFDRQDRSYRLAILATHWLRGGPTYNPSAVAEARSLEMAVGNKWVTYGDLGEMLDHDIVKIQVTSDFVLNQLHALIRAPFELLRAYCKDYDEANSAQSLLPQLRSTPWFEFARFIRNAISHTFRYQFTERDKLRLPITWNGITLREELDGQSMTYELWHKPGYELFVEMRAFARAMPELILKS